MKAARQHLPWLMAALPMAALATTVEMCNTELNLGLFPEDVLSIAAVLQRDHCRFAEKP